MISVTLYSKDDCHLCEEAIQDLGDLQEVVPHKLEIINIEGNLDLEKKFGSVIPIIEVGPYRLKAPFTLSLIHI